MKLSKQTQKELNQVWTDLEKQTKKIETLLRNPEMAGSNVNVNFNASVERNNLILKTTVNFAIPIEKITFYDEKEIIYNEE